MLTPVVTPSHSWVRSFGPARRRFGDILIHPDGKRLIAAEDDGTVTVYRLDNGAPLMHLPALLSKYELEDARRVRLRLHPDGVRLFVIVVIIDTSDVTLCWNLECGDLVESYDYPFVPHAFVGDDLAISTNGLLLVLWDLAATKPLKRTLREDASWRLYGTVGEHALVGGRTTVELWNAREGSMRWSVPKENARGAAMLGDLAMLAAPGRIELRSLAGEVIREHPCPARRCRRRRVGGRLYARMYNR